MAVNKLFQELLKGSKKITPEERKLIFEQLLTSPERKEMYDKLAQPIEDIVTHPATGKAYVGGSFASTKPTPKDIDLFIRHSKGIATPEGDDFYNKFQRFLADPIVGRGTGKEKLHIVEGWPQKKSMWGDFSDPATSWNSEISEAKKRYGKDYKLVRILSAAGLTAGAAEALSPREAEAAGKASRVEILEKVFKEGIESVSKDDLKALFKKGYITRHTPEPKELMRRGFDLNMHPDEGVGVPLGEPQGLYWNKSINRNSYESPDYSKIKGIPRPKAKWENIDPKWHSTYGEYEDQDRILREGHEKSKALAHKGVDFLRYLNYKDKSDYDIVQMRPGNVLAKWGKNYKIIGAGGVMAGLGSFLSPDEAEASPLTEVTKAVGKKVGNLVKSSTSEVLSGKTIRAFGEDAQIKNVYKGGGLKRVVELEDGRVFNTDKADIQRLVHMHGAEQREGEIYGMGQEALLNAAKKAFYRQSKKQSMVDKLPVFQDISKKGRKSIDSSNIQNELMEMVKIDPATMQQADYSIVRHSETGKIFPILSAYVDPLVRLGWVKHEKKLTSELRTLVGGKFK